MYKGVRNDECLICYQSLLKNFNLYSFLLEDDICQSCRSQLNNKLKIHYLNDYKVYSFYQSESVVDLIIRFKDFYDIKLAKSFLVNHLWLINILFKDYTIILIPSSLSLLKQRNFNHLKLMLEKCKLKVVDCLKKDDSVQRFSKDRSQVKFYLTNNNLKFDKVIIFDDIITSGNSILKVAKLIEPICNKLVIMTLYFNFKIMKEENYGWKSKVV